MHSNNSSDNNNDYYHHHGDKGHHHRDKRSSSNSPNPCILYHHEGRHAGVWAVHPFESDGQTAICSVSSDGTFRCSYVSSSNCHHGTPHTASCSKSHIDRWVMQGFKIDKVQDTTESNSCSRSRSNSSYDSKDRNIDNRESFHATERDSQMTSNSNAGPGSGISMRSLSEAENSLISGSGYVIPNTTINSSSGSSSGCGSTDVPSGDHNNCAAAGGAPAATGGAAGGGGAATAGSVWCGPSADVYVSARGTLDLHSNQLKRSHSAVALHAVDSTSLTFLNSNASSGNYSRNDRNNSDNRNWNYDRTYSNDINNNSNSNSICNNNHDYSTTRLFAYGGAAGLLRVHTIDIHDRILN